MKTVQSGVFLLVVFFLTAACSVKEDREKCPCRLVLDFTEVDTSLVRKVNVLAASSDGIVFFDSVDASDFDVRYIREVSHSPLRVNVWGGEGTGADLQIPYGCECPHLYMHVFEPDTSGEMWLETVSLKKNYCRLTILLEGRDDMPYSLTFKGNIDGYGQGGQPSDGDFACVAYPVENGGSQVLVPRQTDSSLLMEVDDVKNSNVKTFAIGEYLSAAGYDWTADELDDATVVIDYYLTGIKITYSGWDKEYTYDIVI